MKFKDVLSTIFLICVVFMLASMLTKNLDMFMWAAGIGDVIGISYIVIDNFFDKLSERKIW
jgi:O-antigen/teichoic acid export membrane protein